MVDRRVALETTLLVHGVPRAEALPLFDDLAASVRAEGAVPALCGLVRGRFRADLSREDLAALLAEGSLTKANTSNLGVLAHRGLSGATTVGGTMEIAAHHGIRFFATGGLGGVHRGYGTHLDISADLAAFTRFPVAVVTSGVKSILDVEATREVFETLGVPVVGAGTDRFPAFYVRESQATVDARFDDLADLAAFARSELERSGRGIVIANPIPESDAIDPALFERWLEEASARVTVRGRAATPALLAALVEVSRGATLRANLALVRANARLAARLAAA